MADVNTDVHVTGYSGNSETDIANRQGLCNQSSTESNSLPANNDFSSSCASVSHYTVQKSSNQTIEYRQLTNEGPTCFSAKVDTISCYKFDSESGGAERCIGSEKSNPADIKDKLGELWAALTGFDDPKPGDDTIIALVDSDASDQLLKTTLDSFAPYIGDSALASCIADKVTPFDGDSLLDVLKECAPLTDYVLEILEHERPSIYAEMVSYTEALSFKISPRAMLEDKIGYYQRQIEMNQRELLRYYLVYDTNAAALDSALNIYDSLAASSNDWAKERTYLLFRMNQADSAKSYANNLSGADTELSTFRSWIDVLHTIETDSAGMWKIQTDTTLESVVRSMADPENEYIEAAYARVLLHLVFGDTLYRTTYPHPAASKKSEVEEFFEEFEDYGLERLMVFPNPASEMITVNYLVSEEARYTALDIYSQSGRIVSSYELNPDKNTKEIGISNLSQGAYVCILRADGEIIDRQKLIVLNR